MTLFAEASKQGFAVGKDLDLADVVTRITAVLVVDSVPELALLTCYYGPVCRIWNSCDAVDLGIATSEIIIFASGEIAMLQLQVVEVTETCRAGIAET